MGTLAKVSKQFKKNTCKNKRNYSTTYNKNYIKNYKKYTYCPAPNQNIDKVTDIIPDSHLASRGPFKGTGMLLRAQLGGRTSQETPSHHRQGADRRWNEVLIMLPSDIRYIYIYIHITLYYIMSKFLLSFLLCLIIFVWNFFFVTVGDSRLQLLSHAPHSTWITIPMLPAHHLQNSTGPEWFEWPRNHHAENSFLIFLLENVRVLRPQSGRLSDAPLSPRSSTPSDLTTGTGLLLFGEPDATETIRNPHKP